MKKIYSLAILAACAMMVFSCKNEGKGSKEIKDAAQDAVEAVQEAAQEGIDVVSDASGKLEKLGDIFQYNAVDVKPTFESGDANAFVKYVQQNLKYPENALENDVEGKVTVNFVVDANGKIRNAKVVKGVDPELDAEALRVVENAPAWTPAQQNGKNVPVNCSIPVTFKIIK